MRVSGAREVLRIPQEGVAARFAHCACRVVGVIGERAGRPGRGRRACGRGGRAGRGGGRRARRGRGGRAGRGGRGRRGSRERRRWRDGRRGRGRRGGPGWGERRRRDPGRLIVALHHDEEHGDDGGGHRQRHPGSSRRPGPDPREPPATIAFHTHMLGREVTGFPHPTAGFADRVGRRGPPHPLRRALPLGPSTHAGLDAIGVSRGPRIPVRTRPGV
ncbi:MAG: hypothetical protein F4X26_02070 [Chloroflexi bacterium]|nr:hypothetical protein [Chloroflexota bacterium]